MPKLNNDFYLDDDVVKISKLLLGKSLFTRIPYPPATDKNSSVITTGGIIVETEAYAGTTDRASHAYGNRRTKRTETMYLTGGMSYVYLCYGMHSMFNIVTNKSDIPHAILIRAIEPTHGIEQMLRRRNMQKREKRLTSGPGTLTKALGIDVSYDKTNLSGNVIWIENTPQQKHDNIKIEESTRIGIDYAGIDAKKLWRFTIKNNPWISKSPST